MHESLDLSGCGKLSAMSHVRKQLLRHSWRLLAVARTLSDSLHDVNSTADDGVQKLQRRILSATDAFGILVSFGGSVVFVDDMKLRELFCISAATSKI